MKNMDRTRRHRLAVLRPSASALLLLWSCASLALREGRAQALPTATAPGSNIVIGGTYSEFKPQYPQKTLGGASFFVDLNLRRQFGLEGEGRWLRQGEVAGSHQTTYLIGPKLQLHRGIFSPYAKGLVGNGNLKFPYNFGYGNYLVIATGGGLDISVTEKIAVRLVDFEYQFWPQFSLGAISPYGLSAGVSYRIYNPGGWSHRRYR